MDLAAKNAPFASFPAEHDNRHVLRKEPNARESNALMLLLPDHGIAGWVYPTVNGDGMSRNTGCLFGPAVAQPILEHVDGPVPDTMTFSDWRVGGVRMALGKPHQSLDASWRSPSFAVDFHYEALHPVYAFSSAGDKGSPPYYGDDRTEQHGIVTGRLEWAGKAIDFRTIMPRDHSWGPRVWGLNQHHKWFHAATERVSIHFFEMQSYGRTYLQGYLFKDGLMAHIEHVEYDFTFDDGMVHRSIDVLVRDAEGRSVVARCTTYADIRFEPAKEIVLIEAATRVSIEGENGVGWCEFCWNRDYWTYAQTFPRFLHAVARQRVK